MDPESLTKCLAKRLREIRRAQGLTQQDLEGRGISYKYYQRIEAGRVNLTLRSLEKLAKALGVNVMDLFSRSGSKRESLRRRSGRKD